MTIIKDVPVKYVAAITGGGTAAIGNILKRGGASAWFLEGIVPYAKESLVKFLGKEPEKFVSERTANQMALKAYMRAIELGAKPEEAAGLGCTAVLGRIENERAGREHRAYISVQTHDRVHLFVEQIPHWIDVQGREYQEDYIAEKIQQIMLTDDISLCSPTKDTFDQFGLTQLLLSKKREATTFDRSARFLPYVHIDSPFVVYSGSFDPFHEGHAAVIQKLAEKTRKPVYLELSVRNVDKPDVDLNGLADRMASIYIGMMKHNLKSIAGVILTNMPKFFDKLSLLGPKASFVVGSDTASRMVDNKYGNVESLFDLIEVYGTEIFVCERPGYSFVAPKQYEQRFTFLPGTGLQISSTELRNQQA